MQILAFKPAGNFEGWSYHVFQALSWIDLAKRNQSTSALQYAALELRLGMEYLLFELLFLASPGLTEAEYAIGDPNKIKKMILQHQPQHHRLCRFPHRVRAAIAGTEMLARKIEDRFGKGNVRTAGVEVHVQMPPELPGGIAGGEFQWVRSESRGDGCFGPQKTRDRSGRG